MYKFPSLFAGIKFLVDVKLWILKLLIKLTESTVFPRYSRLSGQRIVKTIKAIKSLNVSEEIKAGSAIFVWKSCSYSVHDIDFWIKSAWSLSITYDVVLRKPIKCLKITKKTGKTQKIRKNIIGK